MFGALFIVIIDRIMRNTNNMYNKNRGIRWKFTNRLEDLDYADDLELLARLFTDLQNKTDRLHDVVDKNTGLKNNDNENELKKWRQDKNNNLEVEYIDSFLYLGHFRKNGR